MIKLKRGNDGGLVLFAIYLNFRPNETGKNG